MRGTGDIHMQQVHHPSREILRAERPLVRRIVTITSKRRRLSEAEEEELSRFVVSQMNGSALGPFRGDSSLRSYLAVVVQRLYNALTGGRSQSAPEPSPVEAAIRRLTSSLSAREALILKMWFESGMTTQKIATVLGMHPTDVHAVIARRTDGVQQSLARSHTTTFTEDD
jgi:hypothetical protein